MGSKSIIVCLLFLFVISILSVPQDIVTPASVPKTFRKDYTYDASTEKFYKVHKIPLKFQDAANMCKYEGAELVVPKTEGDATFLRNLLLPETASIWVALHDIYAEGDFVTLDDVEFNVQNGKSIVKIKLVNGGTKIDNVYNMWNEGEPNNVNDNENCVVLTDTKKYNDIPCDFKIRFVCSKNESEVHYNWLCETHDKDYFYNIEGDRCYKLHTVPQTWRDAYKICRAEEAALAVVNSETEAKFLADTFNTQQPENKLKGNFDKFLIHLDFSDLLTPGIFQTSDGKSLETVGYDNWAPTQPDNYQGIEHCGSMFRSGLLNDVNCNNRALFFCEKVLGVPPSFALLQRVGYNQSN